MGRRGSGYSRRQGAKTGKSLKDVGVNVNLAPVLDVGRRGSFIRAEHRSFGAKPGRVIDTAVPFATAMQDHGVAATGKHFPGLGAAKQNTDNAVQKIKLSAVEAAEHRREALRPVRIVRRRHGDAEHRRLHALLAAVPRSPTKKIATGELRRRIGFNGVSITDALETPSVDHFGGPVPVGVDAAKAGTDLLLYSDDGDAAKAGQALQKQLKSGRLNRAQAERSVNRVLRLRAGLGK